MTICDLCLQPGKDIIVTDLITDRGDGSQGNPLELRTVLQMGQICRGCRRSLMAGMRKWRQERAEKASRAATLRKNKARIFFLNESNELPRGKR